MSPADSSRNALTCSSVRLRASVLISSSLTFSRPRLEGLHDGAGDLRATEQVAVGAVPELDIVRPVLIALVGAAANVDKLCGHLRVETQCIERRVDGQCDNPLVGAGDGTHDLVGACRHLGAHEHAALLHVVDAADGAGDPSLCMQASERVGSIASAGDVGEVGGREGPAGAEILYALSDDLCLRHGIPPC